MLDLNTQKVTHTHAHTHTSLAHTAYRQVENVVYPASSLHGVRNHIHPRDLVLGDAAESRQQLCHRLYLTRIRPRNSAGPGTTAATIHNCLKALNWYN